MALSRIAVLGGTGFLGRQIVRDLVLAGRPVRIAARHPAEPALSGVHASVELYTADIRNDHAVASAIHGTSGVVNAVGLYVERGDATFEAIHVEGAARIARRARNAGARLVHISGIGADPASPSKYVAARGRGEATVLAAHPEAIIVRPSVMFGRDDAFLSTLKTITRLPMVPLFGNGSTRLQPVHVDDVATAVNRMLTVPFPAGQVFELGGSRIYTYREILELVLQRLGHRRLLLPVPFSAWKTLASLGLILPNAPLTKDQVILMEKDNIVGSGVNTFFELGIEPRSLGDGFAEEL